MYMGDGWENNFAYGHDGNDTLYLPRSSGVVKFYGGNGDDRSIPKPFEELT